MSDAAYAGVAFFLTVAAGFVVFDALGTVNGTIIPITAVAVMLYGIVLLFRLAVLQRADVREVPAEVAGDSRSDGNLQPWLEEQARKNNRAQWTFFLAGLVLSIPIGLLVNLLSDWSW